MMLKIVLCLQEAFWALSELMSDEKHAMHGESCCLLCLLMFLLLFVSIGTRSQ